MKTMNNARIQVENQKKYVIIKLEQNRTKGEKMVLVATQVKRRRGTTAENDAFTGAEGEITVDLTKKTLRVHDGSTQGGTELAKSSDIYTQTEIDDLLSGKSSTDLSNITATGKETIAHQAMPSNRHVDLTLPASGQSIIAPADGWVVLSKTCEVIGQFLLLENTQSSLVVVNKSASSGGYIASYIEARKGDSINVQYNLSGATRIFRFVYAEGAQ